MYVEVYTDEKSLEIALTYKGETELPKGSVIIGLVKRNGYVEGACLKYDTGEMVSYNNGKAVSMPKSDQVDIK
ncbi:MAG: hypothetical protein LHV68_04190 [Elusimicrobia bacterium]|nr:hypothetical protein [Candidatus Liberimonas magnetica]